MASSTSQAGIDRHGVVDGHGMYCMADKRLGDDLMTHSIERHLLRFILFLCLPMTVATRPWDDCWRRQHGRDQTATMGVKHAWVGSGSMKALLATCVVRPSVPANLLTAWDGVPGSSMALLALDMIVDLRKKASSM